MTEGISLNVTKNGETSVLKKNEEKCLNGEICEYLEKTPDENLPEVKILKCIYTTKKLFDIYRKERCCPMKKWIVMQCETKKL